MYLDALRRHEDVAAACELPHNTAVWAVRKLAGNALDEAAIGIVASKEPPQALDLKSFLAFADFDMADHSEKTQMRFLLNRGIPTRFTDAALIGEGPHVPLDHNDASTAASLTACFNEAAAGIRCDKDQGMYARNRHMVDQALQHARAAGPRILYHICGNAHVVDGPFSQSLPGLFREAGMPIALIPQFRDAIQRAHFLHRYPDGRAAEIIPASFLSEATARRDSGHRPPWAVTAMIGREAEAAWLSASLEHIGRPDLVLPLSERNVLSARCRKELRRHYLG